MMRRGLSWAVVVVLAATIFAGAFGPSGEALASDELIGGSWWVCPSLGVLTGLSIVTGAWISAGGFLVSAGMAGCLG